MSGVDPLCGIVAEQPPAPATAAGLAFLGRAFDRDGPVGETRNDQVAGHRSGAVADQETVALAQPGQHRATTHDGQTPARHQTRLPSLFHTE